jgi:8-oxo-dGTP pyrophosphatase MutT (NUDIX family)
VRALVVDDDWSPLLVRLEFPTWAGWVLPGGGIADGEEIEAALHRELAVERGLVDAPLAGPIWERTVLGGGSGAFAGQSEVIYLVRSVRFDPAPHFAAEELLAEGVTAIRRWGLDELAACDDVLAPSRLPALIAQLMTDGLPSSVIDVGE